MTDAATLTPSLALERQKTVLNAGCGPYAPHKLHQVFRNEAWREVRLDIDPRVKPDVVSSLTNLSAIPDGTFDAVWSSHSIEHLFAHQVPLALGEFRRILKEDGFLLITCPDLETVATEMLSRGLDAVLYTAGVGPVTALDIFFGHGDSIKRGNVHMAHRTGFTAERLGTLLIDQGYAEARVVRGSNIDLWALGLMPEIDATSLFESLKTVGLDLSR